MNDVFYTNTHHQSVQTASKKFKFSERNPNPAALSLHLIRIYFPKYLQMVKGFHKQQKALSQLYLKKKNENEKEKEERTERKNENTRSRHTE